MDRLVCFCILLFTLSCSQAEENTLPKTCFIPRLVNQAGVICEKIQIKENPDDPDSRTIDLAYVVLKARSSDPKKDPILYLQGGPGGAGTASATQFFNSPLHADRDFVIIDQRGTGYSSAVCTDLGSKLIDVIALDLDVPGEEQELVKIAEGCKKEIKSVGQDQSVYNTIQNVKDLELLRKHLGYEQWNLFGGSYGSRLALAYMRDYPDQIRSSVMLGMFPPHVNLYEFMVSHLKRSVTKVFESCASDDDCNSRYPNLKKGFFDVLTELKDNPVKFSYRGNDFVINQQDMLLLSQQLLYTRGDIAQFPAFVWALKNNDSGRLSSTVRAVEGRVGIINFAMNWSFMAYDEIGFMGHEAMEEDLRNNPEFNPGPAFFVSDNAFMNDWHSYRAPKFVNEPVRSDIPSLVANGAFDPVTPPAYAKEAVKYLKNVYYAEFPTHGHSTVNGCFFGIMQEFLDNPFEAPDLSCSARELGFNWR